MALVKFYNGSTENLNNLPIKEGQIIFSVSNGNGSIFYDSSNSSRIKMTALADRAIADNLGNNIDNTYISNLTGTTSKTNYVITPKTASGNNKTAITIPAASSTIAGLMTTETQTFAGNKTFNQTVTFLGSADANLGSYTYPAVTIGPYASAHLEIDANEIMAKGSANTAANLYLNNEGGVVDIGPGGMNVRGHIIPNATTRTLDIGSTNNYFRNVYGTNFYGTATNASQLTSNDVLSYTSNTVRYFNIHSPVGTAANANNIPTNTWWHILRFIRADGNKYYTDLAIPFEDNSIYYKRIVQGEVTNTSNTALKGWVKVLDEINYTNYTVTKTGSGASGTWGINITGNAVTATRLQTARTINGTSFNGTANITTNIWGATRTLTIGHTAKSVNGSSNVSWSLNEIIKDSSIYPKKIAISDYYNYAQLNTSTASLYGWSSTLDENGVIYTKTSSMFRDIPISIKYYCNGGETFEIKGQISSSIKGNSTSGGTDSVYKNSAVMLICSDGKNNNPGYIFSKRGVSSANAEWVDIHSYVTIPTNSKNFGVYIQTESYGNWSGTLKVRNIEVIKIPSVALALRTARTINGTAFDGTANITTTNWGSTRNFYIADASAAHTGSAVSVNGSSNVTLKLPSTITATLSGTASNAQWLIPNNNLTFGASGLQYFNLDGDGGTSPTANNTPTSAWYHILRMNHGNSAGYYADIAVPLNDTAGIYWRQIRYGTNYGWFKLLDSNNYTNYTVTKTGSGASGTWGINVTGNAGTATKLQTSRKINGILFNGSFNIDTYVAQFNLGAPAGSTGWSKLGTWSNTEQCDTCYIWVFGGDGQNGRPDQNGELHIFIKDGYQSTSSATGAFGVTVTKYTNADDYEVQVRATSGNSCEVWVKAPYTYSSGKYIISIPTDTIWVHEGKYTPIEPTNGTLQLHEYFTILNNTSNAASATKLQTARTISTNLSSTSTASFDGTTNITPGITGTLSVSHGGTGATSIGASLGRALYNLGLRYSTTEPSNPVFGMVWLKPV